MEEISDVWILALFKKFQGRYLHKWTSAIEGIEVDAVKEWKRVLSGLSGEQIKRGLDTWSEDWPPSADEFKAACKGAVKNGFGLDYVPQMYREQPTSEVKRLETTGSKETRESSLATMREKLKRNG